METMYKRRKHSIIKCVLVILSTFQAIYFLKFLLNYFDLTLFQITDPFIFFGILLDIFCLAITIYQFYVGLLELFADIRKEQKKKDEEEEENFLKQIEDENFGKITRMEINEFASNSQDEGITIHFD